MKVAHLIVALISGFLLALALAFGDLTRPEVIIGWVDWFGSWDPHMLVFFAPAALVYSLCVRLSVWRQKRFGGPTLCLPTTRKIDARLVIGSSIFGIGWGIGGACPGPALTSLGAGAPWALIFVLAMGLGLSLGEPATPTKSSVA
ncbi:MAG: DUF6691 family protein [Myxococcota bacterium]